MEREEEILAGRRKIKEMSDFNKQLEIVRQEEVRKEEEARMKREAQVIFSCIFMVIC